MKTLHPSQVTPNPAPDPAAVVCDPQQESLWIEAVANGDRAAFRKLHDRFERLIFTTAYKVLGNYEDSQDVCQEVFAQIWAKAHLFDASKGKPLTWATTMARNRAIDRYRSKQRRASLDDRFGDHVAVLSPASTNETEDAVSRNETSRVLRSAVLDLTPAQREAVELAYFAGLTQKEVAERVGEPIGTVKARIRRAIQRLERKVAAAGVTRANN